MTTREEIIKLAREAGLVPTLSSMPFLEAFYQAAYAAGMGEAAKVCDDLWQNDATAYDCREAIREKAAEVTK